MVKNGRKKEIIKLNKSSISLIICSAIGSIIGLFTNTFLMGYMLQVSESNILHLALYYLVLYAVYCLCYMALSVIVKKSDRVYMYRIGIIIKCIYILLIALSQNQIQKYVIIMGLLYGISEAFTCSSFNVIKNEILQGKQIKKYISINSIVGNLINIIFPIILAQFISVTSFIDIAVYVLCFGAVQFGLSFLVKVEKSKDLKFRPFDYMKMIRSKKDKYSNLPKVYFVAFLEGIRSVHNVLITLLIIMTFNTTINLGYITSIFSVINIAIVLMFLNLYKAEKSKIILLVCSILPLCGTILLMFEISKTTFIIYNLIYAFCLGMLTLIFDLRRNETIRNYKLKSYISEHQSIVEIYLTIGRLVSFSLLIVFCLFDSLLAIKIFICIAMLIVPVYAIVIRKIEKQIAKDNSLGETEESEGILIENIKADNNEFEVIAPNGIPPVNHPHIIK